jgi:hypothetical protein
MALPDFAAALAGGINNASVPFYAESNTSRDGFH